MATKKKTKKRVVKKAATKKRTIKSKRLSGVKAKSNKKIGTMGSKIMTKAKQIRKANPNLKWTTCVSRAAKSL